MTEKENRVGYKKTKWGLIPSDWELIPIKNLAADYRGGASLKPTDFTKNGIKVLPKGGVIRGGNLIIQEKTQQYCSIEYANLNKNSLVDKKFLIVVLRDLVPSGPNIGLIVTIRNEEKYILAQGVYGLIINKSKVSYDYLIQFSNSEPYRKMMQKIMVGSTQVHIRNSDFLNLKIPIPSPIEQQKIAKILSAWDEAIATTEKLIAAKEKLKKGLMQQLLTGKKRFKEFVDDNKWEKIRLGDYCELITKGTTPTSVGFNYQPKGINFIKAESIDDNGKFLQEYLAYIDEETNQKLGRSKIKQNDLLFSIAGVLGRVAIASKNILPANTNQALSIIRLKKGANVDIYYLYY